MKIKKGIIATIIMIATWYCSLVKAQNLVLNPSFESFITCPGFGQFNNTYINDWSKPTIASSDYYHYNCAGIAPTVQAPRTGEAYSGIIAYNFGTEYREYIMGTLAAPLVAGQIYDVEFYVSLNNGYIQAIVEMGAYLSATPPGPFSNALHINVVPQIENSAGPLQDTVVWKRVNGQFTALGGEQYITIGNFHNDTTTTISQPGSVGSFGAYYFIDDVSVQLDSTTALQENNTWNKPEIYFNATNSLMIKLSASDKITYPVQMTVYDLNGKELFNRKLNTIYSEINFEEKANGLYFVRLMDSNNLRFSAKIPFSK